MDTIPFRQIHLDFHTSEEIPGVGKDWDKGHFQSMLQLGHVNSINIFAKCHHGWSYHPTSVPLSQTHPTLKIDLLGEMIAAAHEIGVKVPVYLSIGLDEKLVRTHTHWLRRNPDGSTGWVGWMQAGYHEFCLRSPYLDYVIAQVEEVTRNYDVDGLWLDIVGPRVCVCQTCIAEMRARGIDPRDEQARKDFGRETYFNYTTRMNAAIHGIKPDALIFHNHGFHAGDREAAFANTHIEMESLPTGGWGYDHFPVIVRYTQQLGRELIGMTGKFHTTWGEFGGYKHPNALRYEAALALMHGAKINVGDQMHPFGKLDPATYQLVGEAFAEVEPKEPWCHDVANIADVGLLSLNAVAMTDSRVPKDINVNQVEIGASRVLREGKILHDILDTESDFSRYKVIILPDAVPVNEALQAKLTVYLNGGGKILATGASALDAEAGRFVLDFGVEYRGDTTLSPTFLAPRFPLAPWGQAGFVIYSFMKDIAATTGQVLADRQDPFFNRDYLHFCSHQHAPSTQVNAGPAMVATASTVYLAFAAFQQYAEKGQNVLREIILHGLRSLYTPTLTTSLPAQGLQTVQRQECENRTVVHLLYGAPVKRGQGIEVIEDLLPVYNIDVALRVPAQPKRVYLAPQGTDLPFTMQDGVMRTTVPVVECHQMVVVE